MRPLQALCLTGAFLAGGCGLAGLDPAMRQVAQLDACGFEVDLGDGSDFRSGVRALLSAAGRQAEALASSALTGVVSGPATTDLARHREIARFGVGVARALHITDVVIGVEPLDPDRHASFTMGVSVCGSDLFRRVAAEGPKHPHARERFQVGDVTLTIPVIYGGPSAGWIEPSARVSRFLPTIMLDRQTRRPFADLEECRGSLLAADCEDRLLLVYLSPDRVVPDRRPAERHHTRDLRLESESGSFQADCVRADTAGGDSGFRRCVVRSRSLPSVRVQIEAGSGTLRQAEIPDMLGDVAHLIISFAQANAAGN